MGVVMLRRMTIAVILALGWVAPAWAGCGPEASEVEQAVCLAQDLRDSDKRINAVYKALMGNLDEAGKTALRDEQRAWLKRRDKACTLDTKESDREKWLQGILADQGRTLCVVRYTFSRVTELDAQLQAKAATPPADLPPAPSAPVQLKPAAAAPAILPAASRLVDDGYALEATAARRTGKWYYEVWIDRGGIAKLGDALVRLGYVGPESGVSNMVSVRRKGADLPPVSFALAIDLDNGKYYARLNGMWNYLPGSNGGLDVKLGRDWRALVQSSTDLEALLRAGLVKVNLGERPFEYALPDGYRPYSEK